MKTKREVLNKICAILIITAMMITNFWMVGEAAVSYAIDAVKTSNANVHISAYFVDENGEEVESKNKSITEEEESLYIKIGVKNDGYFNGTIKLENPNFAVSREYIDEGISSITDEGNIVLKQINAGTEEIVELKVNPIKNISGESLQTETKIKLEGEYINSKNVDKDKSEKITAETKVKLNLISPEDSKMDLSSEVFTNKTYEIDGINKKLVQILVRSKITDNNYPVKTTNIKLSKIDGTEDVRVQQDSKYLKYTDLEDSIEIKLESNEENIYKEQELIVTYILPENIDTLNKDIALSGNIETYDNKTLNTDITITTGEEKEGIVSYEIESEQDIYKGKLLINEAKEYKTSIKVNVNYLEVAKEIKFTAEPSTFLLGEEKITANNIYKETKINKDEFLKIFGEDGYLTITDEMNTIIANINADSEVDEEGNIVVKYLGETRKIEINTSEPVAVGSLTIENVKEIRDAGYDRETKNSITYLNEKLTDGEGQEKETQIELKNTTTEATLEISTDTLSTLETNKNVKITIKLLNNDETKDLYQNPKLKVKLPSEVKNLKAKCKLLYGNGLTLGNSQIIKENDNYVLDLNLEGTQNSYNAEMVEGTTIIIYADMELDELAPNTEESIQLQYTNELATSYISDGATEVPVNIESRVGVFAINNIEALGVTTIGDEETEQVKLSISEEQKAATIELGVINNEETNIKDAKILGHFPTRESDNLGITLTSGINIEQSEGIKIYYSDKEDVNNNPEDTSNNWYEEVNLSTSKSYLIVVDNINSKERLTANYSVNIPGSLDYDMSAKEGYTITYTNETTNEVKELKATELDLTTGAGPDLDMSVKAIAGNDIVGEGKDVADETGLDVVAGEIIKYEVTLTNNGTAPATNVAVKEIVPEQAEPLEYVIPEQAEPLEYENANRPRCFVTLTEEKIVNEPIVDAESGEQLYDEEGNPEIYTYTTEGFASIVNKEIEKIEVGETKTLEFYIRPTETDTKKITNEFQVAYNGKNETKYSTNSVKDNNVSVTLEPGNADSDVNELIAGNKYLYILKLNNNSEEVKNNVKVNILNEDLFNIDSIVYTMEDNEFFEETSEFTIDELSGNIMINIYITPKETTTISNTIDILTTINCDGEIIRSNKITKTLKTANLDINLESDNVGEEIEIGQEINYKITLTNAEDSLDLDEVKIEDTIFKAMEIHEVLENGEILSDKEYSIISKNNITQKDNSDYADNYYSYIEDPLEKVLSVNTGIKAGETKVLEIKCSLSENVRTQVKEPTEIKNIAEVITDTGKVIQSNEIIHLLNPEEQKYEEEHNPDDYATPDPDNPNNPENPDDPNNPENPDDPNNPNNPDDPNNPNNPDNEEKTYTISGMAWFDANENGEKESGEQRLSGITAKLMNLETNETKTTTTSESGFYSFTGLINGKYVVIFEYDTEKYMLTTYQADEISANKNSDAENVTMKIDGEERKVSSTDTLTIKDNSISNIDIGLVLARTFDLELAKTISKVTITNGEGTKTTNYNGATYAKAEINAKYAEDSTIVVEYKIKVSNTGELAGYAKSIIDYKPKDLTFDSSLNNGWYQSGDNLYSNSLANTKIEPGESKELTLVLIKRVTENNMGLVNNLAEINEDYTALGIADKDSTPGNKQNGEDDLGSSDLSIGVKTGAAVSYITFTIFSIMILLAVAYFVNWKLMKSKKFMGKEE